MCLWLRVGIGGVLLSLLLVGSAAAGKHDGRIRIDAVHDCLLALREPVDNPDKIPTAWATANACLSKIGPDDRIVLPALIAGLHDPVPRVRAAAAGAIARMGPEARNAVPALRSLLGTPGGESADDLAVIQSAITALGQIGDDAVIAADDLVLRFAGTGNCQVQESLLRFGPAAVPALTRGLRDSHSQIRQGCLAALASLNCPAPVAPERQLELLADQSEVKSNSGCLSFSIPVGRAAVSAVVRCGTPLIEPLRRRLANGNPVVRVRAACALAQLKVFDQDVADRLAEGYRQANLADEVADAIQTGKRTQDPRLLSALHRLLSDRDSGVRERVASALIGFNAVDEEVVRTEIGLLSQPDFPFQAANFLFESPERVRPFASELDEMARYGKLQHARWFAAGLLAHASPDEPAIAVNLAEMGKKVRVQDPILRYYGVAATYLMGEKGFPTLCQFLRHGEPFALPSFSFPQKALEKLVIAEIRRASEEGGRSFGYVSALLTLASTNCSSETLVPCLPTLIEHACQSHVGFFCDPGPPAALACITRCGKAALPVLIKQIRDSRVAKERLPLLIGCLGRLGPSAREALPMLASRELLTRLDEPAILGTTINDIGPTAECLPFLLDAVSTEQLDASDVLEAIVSLGDRALPAIVHLLESDRPSARQAGAFLIFQLGKKAEPAIPAIINILARGDGNEGELVHLLATFGPPTRAAVPVVSAKIKSRYVRIRTAACLTLARIAAGSVEARAAVIDPLLAATKDDFAEVRAAAADALGLLGAPDAAVRKALEPLQRDSFATVRNAAERALHSGDARYGSQSKVWTLYFDASGPATGLLFSVNE